MRVALIQTNPKEDVEINLREVEKYVTDASHNGASVVVLPEMFTYMGDESQRLKTANNLETGVFLKLQQLALKNNVYIVGGSHAESTGSQHVFNTSTTFAPNGTLLSVYRKIHLFNLKDENGHPLYCESETFLAGRDVSTWKLSDGKSEYTCLTTICYDIRFPEIYRLPNIVGSFDIAFVPAAFTFQTGRDHWEVLLRARAIENQCFIIACNQTGHFMNGQKRNYGNSLVIDPWGKVLLNAGEDVGVYVCDIDLSDVTKARARLPALNDRKL